MSLLQGPFNQSLPPAPRTIGTYKTTGYGVYDIPVTPEQWIRWWTFLETVGKISKGELIGVIRADGTREGLDNFQIVKIFRERDKHPVKAFIRNGFTWAMLKSRAIAGKKYLSGDAWGVGAALIILCEGLFCIGIVAGMSNYDDAEKSMRFFQNAWLDSFAWAISFTVLVLAVVGITGSGCWIGSKLYDYFKNKWNKFISWA